MAVLTRHKSTVFGLVDDLTAIQNSVGLAGDLTYVAPVGSSYLNTATSVKDATEKLDVAAGDLRTDVGTVALTTTNTDLKSAVNELHAELGGDTLTTLATTLSGAINELDAEIGNVSTLTTTSKVVVGAINELDALQGNDVLTTTAQTLTGAVNELDGEIGNDVLNTTASTIKAAINEHGTELGNVSSLTTTAGNVADAINELDAFQGSAILTTTATNLAAAVNELDAGKLEIASNLSDVADVAVARTNLGVYSTGEVDTAITNAQLALGTNFSSANATAAATDFPAGSLSVGDNVFLTDDGDTKWAIYKVTAITDGAWSTSTTEKIMDEDVFLNAQSAASIKSAYESNADTNAYTDEDQARVAKLGASTTVLTTTATEAFLAINELDAIQGNDVLTTTATTLTGAVNELDAEIGNISTLTTTDKSSVVAAINEHNAEIGDVATLTTSSKVVVGAINELDTFQGGSVLNTTAQNLADAVNEVDAQVGNTALLTTTATDLSAAVNELDADKLEKSSNLSDLTDAAAARTNLDVYSKAEVDSAVTSGGAIFITESLTVTADAITLTYEPKNGVIFNFATVRHTDANFVSYDIPVTVGGTPNVFNLSPNVAGEFDTKTVVVQYAYVPTV